MLIIRAFIILIIAAISATIALSQGLKPSVAAGDVVSVSETAIILKTKTGDLKIQLSGTTEYKRVPPENPVLKAAVASNLSEIAVGDKLLVTGVYGDDKTVLPARSIYLMSKAAIAEKQEKEEKEWATRGISGKVEAVDLATNTITVSVRGLMNSTNVAVTPKTDGTLKRYAPNSIKYSEAVESSISDVKPGDMLRALGDKSADGTTFAAEIVLTGAFQTVAGTVKSIDLAKNEVVVGDTGTKKDITIAIAPGTALKKIPEEMAARFAMMGAGGRRPGAAGQGQQRPSGGQGQRPAGGGQGERPAGGMAGQGGRGGMGGGARGGIDDMFERLPAIQAADLKVGDMIAVSSSKGVDPQHITAIKVLAGVEPFMRLAQASGGRRGGRGQDTGFTIPGLDGFDFP